jgi:hypothetical protein
MRKHISELMIAFWDIERGGQSMWHAWERREKCTRFWWENPKERDHLENQGVGGKVVSE